MRAQLPSFYSLTPQPARVRRFTQIVRAGLHGASAVLIVAVLAMATSIAVALEQRSCVPPPPAGAP